ncbi:uncharacterized protein MKZ38_010283 [Zalerion maritima]|uniref:Pre-mRNA-processing factor 39 n=1 Tax=Zalerion maritima TaxID=339359 RepID=A0AAD5WV62_9PEZI|nr:uncharacterized protein MKZ38_010283 [Zalerion maritima]
MGDFNQFGGSDEENAEIKTLKEAVEADSDNFENWEKLVRACEALEGGLNRNSSPQALATLREAYDRFLLKFPLLFGYWKKYADLEFNISGPESAEMVYERGCASVRNSVDLWTGYCSFKMETTHTPFLVRELFDRGADAVGLDFLAHPFWDKYIEYEERQEAHNRVFAILKKIIAIPMHQYARYFDRFRALAANRPIAELVDDATATRLRAEVQAESMAYGVPKADLEIERDVRAKIDALYYETFTKTQTETTRRWAYEGEIKRPYFHVTELEHKELAKWREYLDFEEAEGDAKRIIFLYERCLTTAGFYDEFWFRYARWMSCQPGNKEEEVRNIYLRAVTLFVPISRPGIRLQFAYFEEMCGRVDVARDVHAAILSSLPDCFEVIVSLANLERRQAGPEAAVEVYKTHLEGSQTDTFTKAAILTEWAFTLWKTQGSADEARALFSKYAQTYYNSRQFWQQWLEFELGLPTKVDEEEEHEKHIKQVFMDMRTKSQLSSPIKMELGYMYLDYLQRRGGKDAMKMYMQLDRELLGPPSVSILKGKGVVDELDEATQLKAETKYFKFYEYFGEPDPNAQGAASFS